MNSDTLTYEKSTSWADNMHFEIDFNVTNELTSKFNRFQLCSLHRENDKYDELGRNISATIRRQALIPWFIVNYKN